MDLETLKWFSSLGVGGILAGVMFWFYQKHSKAALNESYRREDRAIAVMDRLSTALSELSAAFHAAQENKRDELLAILRDLRDRK